MPADRLRGALTFATYRTLASAIGHAPGPVADGVAAVIGTVMARKPGGSLALRERHIARVLASTSPEVTPDPAVVRRWALRSYRSYARYWVEGARVPTTPIDVIRRRLIMERGYERLKQEMASGNGVILALPHVGAWEWGGTYLATDDMPMTSVAERIEPPQLFEWFVEQRRAMQLEIVALGDESSRTVLKVLREGGLVGLLCDRDIQGNGIDVDFFGETTTMPAGPATMALRTGASLMVATVFMGPKGSHLVTISEPLDTTRTGKLRDDVARITQELARHFEERIRQHPEQWHLYQPMWPSDRTAS